MMLDWYFALSPEAQLFFFFLAQLCMSLINAFLCFYVWQRRADAGRLTKPLDIALSQSEYGKAIININETINNYDNRIQTLEHNLSLLRGGLDNLNIPTIEEIKATIPPIEEIKEGVYNKVRGLMGKYVQGEKAELQEAAAEVAAIEAEAAYPSLNKAMTAGAELVEQGLMSEEFLSKIINMVNRYPQYAPRAEQLLSQIINNGGPIKGGSGPGWFTHG